MISNLVAEKKYLEAEQAIREQLEAIKQVKLNEVKKMAAAKLMEGERTLKFTVTHHDGSTTSHSVETPEHGYPYPEYISREINKQLKAQGKPTNYRRADPADDNATVHRDRGRIVWNKKQKEEKK